MRRSIKILALSFLAFLFLGSTFPDLLLLLGTLLFGWIPALGRIVSSMAASPGALASAGLATLLIVAGTHWFGLWLGRRRWPDAAPDGGNITTSRWRWRWTLSVNAALATVLFGAMSMVGVAHQTGWLIAAREPIFVSRMRHYRDLSEMRMLAGAIESTGAEQHWNAGATRKLVWGCFRDGTDMQETLHTVFIEGTNGRLSRALVFPRNPKTFSRTGVGIVEPDAPFRTEPATELTKLLQFRPPAAQSAAITP